MLSCEDVLALIRMIIMVVDKVLIKRDGDLLDSKFSLLATLIYIDRIPDTLT